jgi:L-serine dehydratase
MHKSIDSMLKEAAATGLPLPAVVLALEVAESGRSAEEIRERIRHTLGVMRGAIAEGLKGEVRSPSGLTGGRAARLWEAGPRLLGSRVTETLSRAIATL